MELTSIEHIGIAVKNLEESIKFYEDILGLKCYAVEEVEDQKVKTAFFNVGHTKIELLETTDPDGPIAKFIEKRGEGIHHIAFKTDDIKSSLKELKEKNIILINDQPRKGAENLDIAFIHPKSANGVLIEIFT
ncbi:MAG: methylmalonyl-CoA epimerase, partial [Bacteroidetes bacterium]|nr:methylmalonyl-CoA epimerase [Bacteroidota bacterium]